MDISQILYINFPGAEWTLNGDEYSGLNWLDDSPKPTENELEKLWAETQYKVACDLISKERRNAYISESDPIFFQYQRGEKSKEEWLAAVQAVNARYPMPVK